MYSLSIGGSGPRGDKFKRGKRRWGGESGLDLERPEYQCKEC